MKHKNQTTLSMDQVVNFNLGIYYLSFFNSFIKLFTEGLKKEAGYKTLSLVMETKISKLNQKTEESKPELQWPARDEGDYAYFRTREGKLLLKIGLFEIDPAIVGIWFHKGKDEWKQIEVSVAEALSTPIFKASMSWFLKGTLPLEIKEKLVDNTSGE